jgi:hypothetical protein
MVALEKREPYLKKCHCRKFVLYSDADLMVKWGEARWVVTARERGFEERVCKLCQGGDQKSTCDVCKGTGKMNVGVVWNTYGQDIVLLAHRTKSSRVSTPRVPTIESKHILRAYVSNESRQLVGEAQNAAGEWAEDEFIAGTANAAPGTAGLGTRFQHLESVSPEQARMAAERIDEYGLLTLEARAFPGPRKCMHRPEFKCIRCDVPAGERLYVIGKEPEDNKDKGEGRTYDYGRAILYSPGGKS